MNLNYKLYLKYILLHSNQLFIKNLFKSEKTLNLYINDKDFYYLSFHFKLSSLFYSTQLIDIFAYNYPTNVNSKKLIISKTSQINLINNNIIIYNFHTIFNQQRFFIFALNKIKMNIKKNNINLYHLNSITELFINANWLEREVTELNDIQFSGKKDLRNLMLQYGDTSSPLKKTFPSIGLRETFYDSINDYLIQTPVTIQF